ncbi:MAG: prenyltransferase [Desulfobacterales bacterium]|nr:prenyltransferase [Desulfobacterales bacterium]
MHQSLIKLLKIARPQFLISGLALFVFGASWAILLGAPFSLSRILFAYLVLMPAHLSISYSNDYFDVEVDKYDKPTLFSGGSGILVNHPGLRKHALWIAITLILISLVLGIAFQIIYSFPIWFLGFVVLGNLLSWFYTAPPLKLVYRGLGELSMIFSIGLLIPVFGYLAASGQINQDGFLFSVPLMLYGLAFILTVELPDMESDRLGRKMTWVAQNGRGYGVTVIVASFLLATVFFFLFPLLTARTYPLDFRFLGVLSLLPLGAGCIGLLKRSSEKPAATRVANVIMITLAVFLILVDGYMVSLAFSQML